jgi:hypothetical protein
MPVRIKAVIIVSVCISFLPAIGFCGTLWLKNGEVITCPEIKTTNNEIYQLVISCDDTISGKNSVSCGNDSFSIDMVFAKQDRDGYFRKYHTGFVKRVSGGRIAFFKGILVEKGAYQDAGGDVIYNPAPIRTKIDLYSIDNSDLHQFSGGMDKTLKQELYSFEPSRELLIKSTWFSTIGNVLGDAGLITMGLGVINVFHKGIYPFLTGVGLAASGGLLIGIGGNLKKRSFVVFNGNQN